MNDSLPRPENATKPEQFIPACPFLSSAKPDENGAIDVNLVPCVADRCAVFVTRNGMGNCALQMQPIVASELVNAISALLREKGIVSPSGLTVTPRQ